MHCSPDAMKKMVTTLYNTNDVIEVRIIRSFGEMPRASKSEFLYAHQFPKLIDTIKRKNMLDRYNIYLTLNPLKPAMIEHQHDKAFDPTGHRSTDNDIRELRWLFIDLDPIRAAGYDKNCTTDEELSTAHSLAKDIEAYLETYNILNPIVAMSGNGYHLSYRLNHNNDVFDAADQNHKILSILDQKFSTERVCVDTAVANPGRIIKLYGTVSYKGNRRTPQRPPRASQIIHIPNNTTSTSVEVIDKFINAHVEIIDKIDDAKMPMAEVEKVMNIDKDIDMNDINYMLSEIIYKTPHLARAYDNNSGDRSKIEISFMYDLYRLTSDIHIISALMNFRNSGSWEDKPHSHGAVLRNVIKTVGYDQDVYDAHMLNLKEFKATESLI